MKKKVLVIIFGICLNSLSFGSLKAASVYEPNGDLLSEVEFITDNVDQFVYEYNQEFDSNWEASSVEYVTNVLEQNSGETYSYIDFDGENGYIVLDENYELLKVETTGDLEKVRESDEVFWNDFDGLVYLDDDENYVRCDADFITEEELLEYEFNYNGKVSGYDDGSDVIINIPEYLESRYGGKDWYLDTDNSKSLTNYEDVYQEDYALYSNEGNCTLSAFYGIFRYLRDNKSFSSLPYNDVYINPKNDSFYDKYRSKGGTYVPEIYAKIREAAMRYNYTTKSYAWTSTCMAKWANEALDEMGYHSPWSSSYVKMYLLWSFKSQVVDNINSEYPALWNQARGNYALHSMIVKGYKTYKINRHFWLFNWTESKHFMEMNDNWTITGSTTYIDFDGYSKDLYNEGFGTFVVVKDY